MLLLIPSSTLFSQQIPVSKGRKLAPDALEVIEPAAEWDDTALGPVDLPLVGKYPELSWTPNFAPETETLLQKAQDVIYRRDIHCLQFAFKPVRMIRVNGQTVWYLIYRVRYLGGDLQPEPVPDEFQNKVYGKPKSISTEWVRFMPTLELDTLGLGRVYLDRIIPGAKQAIAERERIGKPLYDSVEMQTLRIPLSTATDDNAIWGVAMWADVDPRTDFFAVNVKGLTNALRVEEAGGETKFLQKTLVLHFSRPGDTINELEDRIRYGIPALEDPERQKYVLDQYGQTKRLDHVWDYR
jgi:hypothetical protein